ncbi:hypothetical protein BU17DRAFT_68707 [Hysterangium stoloniferum]|nr:hypothetical protein BU17DRAFT_68707 [Hysterangium stoloniferum]
MYPYTTLHQANSHGESRQIPLAARADVTRGNIKQQGSVDPSSSNDKVSSKPLAILPSRLDNDSPAACDETNPPPAASAPPSPSKANAEIQAATQAQQGRNLSLLGLTDGGGDLSDVPKMDSPELDESGLGLELETIVKGLDTSLSSPASAHTSTSNETRFLNIIATNKLTRPVSKENMTQRHGRLKRQAQMNRKRGDDRMRARRSFSNTRGDGSEDPLMGDEAGEALLGKEDASVVRMILQEDRRKTVVVEVVMENGFTFLSAIESGMACCILFVVLMFLDDKKLEVDYQKADALIDLYHSYNSTPQLYAQIWKTVDSRWKMAV